MTHRAPPDCPHCKKPLWREGKLKIVEYDASPLVEGDKTASVCMHCCKMWVMEWRSLSWTVREPTAHELEVMTPLLIDIQQKFAENLGLTSGRA